MNEIISKKQNENKRRPGNPKFKKGVSGNPNGRPKGAKNKINRDIKNLILNAAFDKRMGGLEGLVKFAIKNDRNKALFYGWLFKMLPSNVGISGQGGEPIIIQIVPAKKKEKNDKKTD